MDLNDIISVLITTVVGSVLAGSTNHLAVQMLFRPYEAVYIGKWQVPFTPGIIPKRRKEMAKSLGETVTGYLLTPTLIREKFLNKAVEDKVVELLKIQWEQLFESDVTFREYAEKFGVWHIVENAEKNVENKITLVSTELINTYKAKTLQEILGSNLNVVTNEYLPKMAAYTLLQAQTYVESDKGKAMIENVISNFLLSKGKFGGILNFMVKDSTLLNSKIREELSKVLISQTAYEKVYEVLHTQLLTITSKPLSELVTVNSEELSATIAKNILNIIAVEKRSEVTLKAQFPQLKAYGNEKVIPAIISKLSDAAETHIDKAIQSFNIAGIVEEQVNSFPVEQLEQLLLGISKKEFQMITYFGFVIGAVIGLIQGIITVLI